MLGVYLQKLIRTGMGLLYKFKRRILKYIEYNQFDPEKYWEQNITVKYLYDKRLKLVET